MDENQEIKIKRRLLVNLYQLTHAMANLLENQYPYKGSCDVPCEYNTTIKPQKRNANILILERWAKVEDEFEALLKE